MRITAIITAAALCSACTGQSKFAMKLVLAVGLFLFSLYPTFSDEMVVMGVGTTSCSQFANLYKVSPKQAENAYFSWAQGFMSAENIANLADKQYWRDLGSMSTEAQRRHLRWYCDQHPLATFLDAVQNLLLTIPPKK